jgi:hypothetical protein
MSGNRTQSSASAASERPVLDSTITDRMKLLNTNRLP